MNVTLVEINIKPERVDEFLEVFRANHEGAIKEPGNLRFDVLQDPRVKTRFFIYEAYKDEEAVLAHKQTPHYLACVDKLEELMSEPRKKRSFVGLLPEQRHQALFTPAPATEYAPSRPASAFADCSPAHRQLPVMPPAASTAGFRE